MAPLEEATASRTVINSRRPGNSLRYKTGLIYRDLPSWEKSETTRRAGRQTRLAGSAGTCHQREHRHANSEILSIPLPLIGGQATLNDEASEVTWFTEEEVTSRLAEPYAVRVTDALSGDWPRIRHHDGTHLLAP